MSEFPKSSQISEGGLEVHAPSDLPEVRGLSEYRYREEPTYRTPLNQYPSKTEASNHDAYGSTQLRERPCGMGLVAYTCLVALLTAIIIGGAVGGGLGGALSHENNKNKALRQSAAMAVTHCPTPSIYSTSLSSAATVPTSTAGINNYNVTSVTRINTVPLNCPVDGGAGGEAGSLDGTTYTTVRHQTFTLHCNYHLVADDIGASVAYTWEDCIESCSSVNAGSGTGNSTFCNAVTFTSEMNAYYVDQHANCWLKNGVVVTSEAQAYFLSATLQPS